MTVNGNQGNAPNYEPNTLGGPVEDPTKKWAEFDLKGKAGRFKYTHPNDNFE